MFGDEGEYLVPGVAFAQGSGSLASNAVALDQYLLNMQEVFGDMSYVVNEAGQQIISSYSAPASRAATHLLNLGNDVISDGSGTDIVIGDNGIVEFRPRQEGNTLHAILAPKKGAEKAVKPPQPPSAQGVNQA